MFLYYAQVDTWAKEAVDLRTSALASSGPRTRRTVAPMRTAQLVSGASTARRASGASTALRASTHSW